MDYLDILTKFRKISRSIHLESKRIEKEFGISIPQLLCLQFLSEQENFQALANQIKDYLNLNASTISGIIKRLEAKALVARLPNIEDKRASFVILTAKGAALLKDSPTTLQEKLANRLEKLSPEKIASLHENIELLAELMDAQHTEEESNVS